MFVDYSEPILGEPAMSRLNGAVQHPDPQDPPRNVFIQPVDSQSKINRFYKLPFLLYEESDHWVPPIKSHLIRSAGFSNSPFYHYAEAKSFLATDGGNDYGRITAIINHRHNECNKDKVGFFGFFESIHSLSVVKALVNAAADWCQARGMSSMLGPVQPSLNYECGLLVEGFDKLPHMGMIYNKIYYASLLEQLEFVKAKDLLAYSATAETIAAADPLLLGLADRIQNRLGINIRRVSAQTYAEDLRSIHSIYNQSLVKTWGFVPISLDESLALATQLRPLIIPELCLIAERKGKPIGSIICIPNYSSRLRYTNGRLYPFGFLKMLCFRSRIREIRAVSTNISPEYHAQGIPIVFMKYLLETAIKRDLTEVEFSWVLECNHLSRSSLERAGFQQTKRYRLYEKNLISSDS